MKKAIILIIFFLSCGICQASDLKTYRYGEYRYSPIAQAITSDNGKVMLQEEHCTIHGARDQRQFVFFPSLGRRVIYGCWIIENEYIVAFDLDFNFYKWDPMDFVILIERHRR